MSANTPVFIVGTKPWLIRYAYACKQQASMRKMEAKFSEPNEHRRLLIEADGLLKEAKWCYDRLREINTNFNHKNQNHEY